MGYLAPGGRAQFNVAIRTAVIDRQSNRIEYGVGGGIIWDSTSSAEYAECLLKARIVTDAPPPFELLETLLWEPGRGYFLLNEHLLRLRDSALYLDVPVDIAEVEAALLAAVPEGAAQPRRARLLVSRTGEIKISLQPAPANADAIARLAVAPAPVNRSNPFLYHKTTHRDVYEQAKAASPGYDDVVLWNEAGEVTETTIANIAIECKGRLITPPVRCGLLAGVFRNAMLAQGKLAEAPITLDELREAPRIFLLNSVRKWRKASVR